MHRGTGWRETVSFNSLPNRLRSQPASPPAAAPVPSVTPAPAALLYAPFPFPDGQDRSAESCTASPYVTTPHVPVPSAEEEPPDQKHDQRDQRDQCGGAPDTAFAKLAGLLVHLHPSTISILQRRAPSGRQPRKRHHECCDRRRPLSSASRMAGRHAVSGRRMYQRLPMCLLHGKWAKVLSGLLFRV